MDSEQIEDLQNRVVEPLMRELEVNLTDVMETDVELSSFSIVVKLPDGFEMVFRR